MQFRISANVEEVKKALQAKHQGVQREVRGEVAKSAKAVRSMLYERTPKAESFSAIATRSGRRVSPYTHIGGRAKAAFTQSPREPQDPIFKLELERYHAEVGSNVPYMIFLEKGTRAHGPVRAKFLRFGLPEAGVVFTKWVKGIRPMRIFARTELTWGRIFPARIRQAVARGLRL